MFDNHHKTYIIAHLYRNVETTLAHPITAVIQTVIMRTASQKHSNNQPLRYLLVPRSIA